MRPYFWHGPAHIIAVSYTHLTTIRIIADGTDEETAVESLVKLVQSGFAE